MTFADTTTIPSRPVTALGEQSRTRVRDLRLDFFRGIAMFIILISHTPGNFLSSWIPARWGFSDATEIFVFCSGMASAIAFGGAFDRMGWRLGTARVTFRVWQVYWAHIGLFVATAAMLAAIDYYGGFDKNYIGSLNLWKFFDDPAVPMIAQWDDHEVTNNWYPNEVLASDDRYTVKSMQLLSARAAHVFHEMMPTRQNLAEPMRVYRKVSYGPLLDIFLIDMRTYRGDNTANTEAEGTPFLGAEQLAWLKREMVNSTATWKVIAADMPIGMMVRDGETAMENGANGDGPVLGREKDVAAVLSFIKSAQILNTVWLTADVHYTAAHHYSPDRAVFQDFDPFWEFVSGPLHAGTFGPSDYDNTFGPEVRFAKHPEPGQANLPPSDGMQFFGKVDIAADTGVMTVRLMDSADVELWSIDLDPQTV